MSEERNIVKIVQDKSLANRNGRMYKKNAIGVMVYVKEQRGRRRRKLFFSI